MTLALLIGFFSGIVLIIYRGLYAGQWHVAFNTLGATIAAALLVYIFLRILVSVGSFFFRLLLIILLIAAIYCSRERLMTLFFGSTTTPSQAVSNTIDEVLPKAR